MEKKRKILELQQRLDTTLDVPDLVDDESIKSLVKDQLLRTSFCGNEGDIGNVVEKRTAEVSNFLCMLRSASGNVREAAKAHEASHNWKIKQDTDQLRVMYREGPHGTPFHTLLAEGYADGPIDVCLCVSWESGLYKKWWPQYNIPTFKITMSTCLQKVGIGEEISLIRVKVPWPVSDREILLHYFEIEYFKEDLIIILLKTISDTEHIDVSTHGFSRDGIPEAKDTVRIDLVGGFVLQKVDSNTSYFRVIANMDIKLDFVPPWLINFISRQLIGNGHKLYQKAVGSVATSDEDYRRALEGPMYTRIREGLDSHNKPKIALVDSGEGKPTFLLQEEHIEDNPPPLIETTPVTEIVEEETENSQCSERNQIMNGSSTNLIITDQQHVIKERAFISPQVEHALRILDRAISIIRGKYSSDDQELPTSETVAEAGPISDGNTPENSSNTDNKPPNAAQYSSSAEDFRSSGTGSASREANYGHSVMSLSKERLSDSRNEKPSAKDSVAAMQQPPAMESMRKGCDEESLRANGFHATDHYDGKPKDKQSRNKKQRLCCFSLSRLRLGED